MKHAKLPEWPSREILSSSSTHLRKCAKITMRGYLWLDALYAPELTAVIRQSFDQLASS